MICLICPMCGNFLGKVFAFYSTSVRVQSWSQPVPLLLLLLLLVSLPTQHYTVYSTAANTTNDAVTAIVTTEPHDWWWITPRTRYSCFSLASEEHRSHTITLYRTCSRRDVGHLCTHLFYKACLGLGIILIFYQYNPIKATPSHSQSSGTRGRTSLQTFLFIETLARATQKIRTCLPGWTGVEM